MNIPRKKCLLILPRLPYPPVGGDKLKSYNLVKILHELYDLSIVIVSEEKLNLECTEFLEKNSIHYKLFIYPKWILYLNALRSLFTGNSLQVEFYYFREVQSYCDKLIAENDIVMSNLIRTAKYLNTDSARYKLRLLDMVDSIAINYTRSIDKVESYVWKMIYTFEAKRLMEFEKECVKNFSATFFVNKSECDYWSQYGNTFHIPNGVNEKLFSYSKKLSHYSNALTFFGKMNYQPNVDAVVWYLKNVHPLVDKEILFVILGANPSSVINKYAKLDNIEVTGFVRDPYAIVNSSFATIAPMQTGAGIQNKVLEGMALGQVNVLSTLAANPILNAEHGKHFLVEDDPIKLASMINDLFKNPTKYDSIRANAKELISNIYTWSNYRSKFCQMILSIENKRTDGQ
jgi:glycosyltransferase involved in cell wall biosynthesis